MRSLFVKGQEAVTSCPSLRFQAYQSISSRISSRTAISAFATATTALRTMINRLIIRFSITGERTPLFALTLPVTTVSIVSVIDSSSPTRAPKPAPPDVLARTCNLFFPLNNMPDRTCLRADMPSIHLSSTCRNIIPDVLSTGQL